MSATAAQLARRPAPKEQEYRAMSEQAPIPRPAVSGEDDAGLTCKPSSVRIRLRAFCRQHEWSAVLVLAALTLALGWLGFRQRSASLGDNAGFFDCLYLSLQLFTMNSGAVPRPVPWPLEVARFLAPALAACTAVGALLALFGEELTTFRLLRTRGHVVVCGLGRKGSQLARDFLGSGRRVVVLEADANNDALRACRDLGALVLLGNAADDLLLERARVRDAELLFATCGEDSVNIDLAARVRRLGAGTAPADASAQTLAPGCCVPAPARASGPTCFVHVADGELRLRLGVSRARRRCGSDSQVRFFNVYQDSARLVLQQYPPDSGPAAGGRTIVVVGLGRKGEGLVVQAAHIGQFADGESLRIVVVDRDADNQRRILAHRYPKLAGLCQLEFHQLDVDRAEFLDGRFLPPPSEPEHLSAVYVGLDSDARTLACSLRLADMLFARPVPIVACLLDDEGGGNVLQELETRDSSCHLHLFGIARHLCRAEALLKSTRDRLARAIHEAYLRGQLGPDALALLASAEAAGKVPAKPAMATWDRLPEDVRNANRHQADHIPVKLRAVGCRAIKVQGTPSEFEFSAAQLRTLERMEHARWVAERYLAGWNYSPVRNDDRRLHDLLVPFDELPDTQRSKDLDTVRRIPEHLAVIGLAVCPIAGTEGPSV